MISPRLKAIADFVDSKERIVDIGCDHSLLAIYLIKKNILENAIVSDINKNALKNAIDNIKKVRLESKIKPILSDGLENIPEEEYDTIIISGMGTKNILNILKPTEKTKNVKKLIIQSNNDRYKLRKLLVSYGYYIADESIVKDNGKYYITIKFLNGKRKHKSIDYIFGKIKKENLEYYEYLRTKYLTILSNIPKRKVVTRARLQRLIAKLNKIIEKISDYSR